MQSDDWDRRHARTFCDDDEATARLRGLQGTEGPQWDSISNYLPDDRPSKVLLSEKG